MSKDSLIFHKLNSPFGSFKIKCFFYKSDADLRAARVKFGLSKADADRINLNTPSCYFYKRGQSIVGVNSYTQGRLKQVLAAQIQLHRAALDGAYYYGVNEFASELFGSICADLLQQFAKIVKRAGRRVERVKPNLFGVF